jgi:mRNA-degrading endonuclease RelE of RelBE toxin-antitoxin system
MPAHVELSTRARRDLRRLARDPDRKPVIDALTVALVAVPPPGNLDVKPLEGHEPWLRLRVGVFRILYRPLTREEVAAVSQRRDRRVETAIWSRGSSTAATWRGRSLPRPEPLRWYPWQDSNLQPAVQEISAYLPL